MSHSILPNDTPLAAGKLPASLLAELLAGLPVSDPQLLLGPAVGEDAAVIDFAPRSDRLLVAKSDPVTFATDEIGYYAVHICANDLAVTGAIPRFYLPTILLPAGAAYPALAERIFQQIGLACRQLHVVVAGGHTEITHTVTQPVVAGTMLGEVARERAISSRGCRPGDAVLLAGVAPIEGISIIAREKEDELLARGWSAADLAIAAGYLYDPGISILTAAQLATSAGPITAMHDPTEGGVITGLHELAAAAQVGLEIDLDAIEVPTLGQRLCAEYGLDPLGVIASGALLATLPQNAVEAVLAHWRNHGRPAAQIGRITAATDGLVAYRQGKPVAFPHFAVDEITKLWA
jgi:hydrogenase expression/formation protein HypE